MFMRNGYRVTEIVGITRNQKQPISLYSHLHSSHEKEYGSDTGETLKALDSVASCLNRRGIFVFDRGYDSNSIFKHMEKLEQNYVIRLTEKRKIYYKGN